MFELQEHHKIIENTLRTFCEKEIEPHLEEMENGEILPFDLMRNLADKFGLKRARSGDKGKKEKKDKAPEKNGEDEEKGMFGIGRDPLIGTIMAKELSRVSPGLCMTIGASVGLCGGTIMAKGTKEQKKKYGYPVLNMEKIGCWGMTEPDSGSDAFALQTIAKPTDDGYILNGSKIFITNAPYADVFVIYAKIDRGQADKRDKRFIFPFVMEKNTKGLSVSKPMKKMGMKSSPTGEVFLDDVFVPTDQLLGETEEKSSRDQAKDVFAGERSGF